MSYFDLSKYAQKTKVASCRNMMKYGHMNEYGIGTDCKAFPLLSDTLLKVVSVCRKNGF